MRVAQDVSPGKRFERRTSPAGTDENYPGCSPGYNLVIFQPSLRDFSSLCAWFPGLRPGLLSAVPAGLNR
jgi:hypothetical protein